MSESVFFEVPSGPYGWGDCMGVVGSVGMGPAMAVLAAGTRRPSRLTQGRDSWGCIWGGMGKINVTAMLEPRTLFVVTMLFLEVKVTRVWPGAWECWGEKQEGRWVLSTSQGFAG